MIHLKRSHNDWNGQWNGFNNYNGHIMTLKVTIMTIKNNDGLIVTGMTVKVTIMTVKINDALEWNSDRND